MDTSSTIKKEDTSYSNLKENKSTCMPHAVKQVKTIVLDLDPLTCIKRRVFHLRFTWNIIGKCLSLGEFMTLLSVNWKVVLCTRHKQH